MREADVVPVHGQRVSALLGEEGEAIGDHHMAESVSVVGRRDITSGVLLRSAHIAPEGRRAELVRD